MSPRWADDLVRVAFHRHSVPMSSLPPLKDFRGLPLEVTESANIQRLHDVRGVQRKVDDHQSVGHGKLDDVERHTRCIAIKKDDVRLAVDLVVVAQPLVTLLEECQEYRPLQHRGVGDTVCSARHTDILADPVFS